jgi:glycosyltransferase involved in cell wall biosynthesis
MGFFKEQVSIILPTYNRADIVRRAIGSVLAQTYTNLELIVVDDGSSDDTEKSVLGFGDQRIVYLKNQQNRGPSGARNFGIKAARGHFISFVDSDDEWANTKLEEQVREIESASVPVIVLTGMRFLNDSTRQIVEDVTFQHSGYVHSAFFQLKTIGLLSMLAPKDCLEEIGLFDENVTADEIWDIGVRLAEKFEFRTVPRQLYIVHLHEKDRQWNKNNLLTSIPYLLSKYSDQAKIYPKWSASKRLLLGKLKLHKDLRGEALHEFSSSIRVYPYLPSAYVLLLAAVLRVPKSFLTPLIGR